MRKNVTAKVQFAALPCRVGESGHIQVMLLTSRETHRWVIPKGWPIKGLKPAEVAVREAYEEAGLSGRIIGKRRIGVFQYQKQLPRTAVLCEVRVFLLWVERQLAQWPEKAERETRWFDAAEAAALVDEDGLAEIIESVATAKRLRRLHLISPAAASTPVHARPDPDAAASAAGRSAFPDTDIPPADPVLPVPVQPPPPDRKRSAR